MEYTYSTRTTRAQRILDNDGVQTVNVIDRTYDVASERNPDARYRVNLKKQSCDCPDAQPIRNVHGEIVKTGNVCKHIIAAQMFQDRIDRDKAKPTPTTYDALLARLGYVKPATSEASA